MTTRPTLHFHDVGLGDVATVGGKGASLGELLRAGIRVPTGFAVTTAAFRQSVAHLTDGGRSIPDVVAGLDPADAGGLAAATVRLRDAVESAPLPDEVAAAVSTAYAALCEECGDPSLPVAVRSSATSEDSAEASFAGQHATKLNVVSAAALLDACPRVDVLVHNAGLWPSRRVLTEDGLEAAFAVNHLAPFLLNHLLWFLPWFLVIALIGSGASGFCPMLIALRRMGFK